MQLISNISKYLLLAVLLGSLLIIWNRSTTLTVWNPSATADESQHAQDGAQAGSVWGNVSSGFQLNHQAQSAQVQAEIRKLLSDQDRLYQILRAAAPYIYFINQQTRARNLPAEIALIPFIESEFNPNDHSNKGALGLWQLMSGTAHDLGVKVKSGYDGRRNIVASTQAALAYFKDLGNNFNGNWYLAIAAYNCGQGRVESATKKAGTENFWNLHLPTETKLYVPKLLAVAEIIEDPAKYGVQLPPIENTPYFTQLKINKSTNLTQIAKTSGIDIKTLQTLNPDYKKSIPKTADATLLVPIDKVTSVKT